ncbi:MAG: hypothetical protein ACYDAM_02670 [Leptospirales bacterium]
MLERDGNTLSPILRVAWDGGKLSPLTKGNRIETTNAHIGFIGQITKDELKRRLTETETSNGFGNRILWFYTRRSKLLPFGMKFERDAEFGKRFRLALEYAQKVGQMGLDEGFRTLWESVYPVLTEAVPGLSGSLTSRAEAHAIRLSMIYALIDETDILTEKHLTASLSVIDFVSDSGIFLFGEATGNPIADKILAALDSGPISLTAVSLLFDGHATKKNIERALAELSESGKIAVETETDTGGRPKTIIRKRGGELGRLARFYERSDEVKKAEQIALEAGDIATWESPLFGKLSGGTVLEMSETIFTLIHPLTGEKVTLSREWLVTMDERSAILEFEGGLPREEADRKARGMLFNQFREGGKP